MLLHKDLNCALERTEEEHHLALGDEAISCARAAAVELWGDAVGGATSRNLRMGELPDALTSACSKPAHCTFFILPLDVVEEFPEALAHRLLLGLSLDDCADPLGCLILMQFIILHLKGIGSGKAPLEQCIQLAERPGVRQHWRACQHLIINDISMVDAILCWRKKQCNTYQGTMMSKDSWDSLLLSFLNKRTICQAESWRKRIHINVELTEVQRQTDNTFVSLLSAVRLGGCTEEVTRLLMQTATNRSERDGILATRLRTHKDDVEITNEALATAIRASQKGEVHAFGALDSDPMLVKLIDAQCPVGGRVELKLGAQVIKMEKWVFKGPSGVHLSCQQLPLKLAWAISIHKSQDSLHTHSGADEKENWKCS
ncbi:hypothetical protein Q9966_003974 [Columba livia]|nr:hypothetical protein Q9966_003974 [Columba livia]